MKFGKYLREALTPEWKKAYIDYTGLKKCINSIRWAQEGYPDIVDSPIGSKSHLPLPNYDDDMRKEPAVEDHSPYANQTHFVNTNIPYCSCSTLSESARESDIGLPDDTEEDISGIWAPPGIGDTYQLEANHKYSPDARAKRGTMTQPLQAIRLEKREKDLVSVHSVDSIKRQTISPDFYPMATTLPLSELLPLLSPLERSFFDLLDAELQKVEKFYLAREADMRRRGKVLEEQLKQLSVHQPFYLDRRLDILSNLYRPSVTPGMAAIQDAERGVNSLGIDFRGSQSMIDLPNAVNDYDDGSGGKESSTALAESNTPVAHQRQRQATRTGTYRQARTKLKKAMLEHYRGLEMLDNYGTLNTIGFQKALKKFEKVTKIPSILAYMREKVEPSSFADGTRVHAMMTDMEQLFASQFGKGDKKKATERLRGSQRTTPHHFSTFRAGLLLGLAVPAFLAGILDAFQKVLRGGDSLLYIYAILFVPTLFSLMVGLNILVWSRSRITYTFIFDLDPRTRLDSRQYFEIPAFLLTTLIYAFWMSFSNIFENWIDPTRWPLIWLAMTIIILSNPLQILFRPSRWWFLRKSGKLLVPGIRPVDFTEFWLADQYCSMVFTLSNLYFAGCTYVGGFENSISRCGTSAGERNTIWLLVFFLGSSPNFIRLIQSIRRYRDTGSRLHLLNGGKYTSSIVTLLFYFKWRAVGPHSGIYFYTWIGLSLVQTAYTSTWDLYMDWSLMRLKCRYRLLRPELVYTSIPVYYFAMISNVLIRFTWLIFIPVRGPTMEIRSFLIGLLEVFRRFQWNFYRVENEHIGNMDQYLVTRDVELPFSFEDDLGDNGNTRKGCGHRLMQISKISLILDTKSKLSM